MSKIKYPKELELKAEQLRKLISFSGLTYLPLHSDFNFAAKQWRQDPTSQFWSRTAIRCLCAAIEATLFSFRRMAEEMATLSNIQFDPKEIEILTEKRIASSNGIQITKPKFLPFPDAVKESFRLFAKAAGTKVTVDYSNVSGFDDLCVTFEIRNRLMHPKKPFDVEVKTKDIHMAERGIHWFNRAYISVIDACNAHIGRTVEVRLAALNIKR